MQIEAQVPVLDIGQIEMHIEIERCTLARADLPESGHAGLHVQAPVVVKLVAIDFIHRMRAWPNQAHLSTQHIPKLRKLVEAEAAKEMSEASDPGIVD